MINFTNYDMLFLLFQIIWTWDQDVRTIFEVLLFFLTNFNFNLKINKSYFNSNETIKRGY